MFYVLDMSLPMIVALDFYQQYQSQLDVAAITMTLSWAGTEHCVKLSTMPHHAAHVTLVYVGQEY